MKSIWIDKKINKRLSDEIQQELGLPLLLSQLLSLRVDSTKDAADFLNPTIDSLESPLSIKGIKDAAKIICAYIKDNKKITVFGDYDADGITGSSILYNSLKIAKADASAVIPSRERHGYGLNKELIKEIKDSGSQLLITVDCGITNTEEVAYANELGMEVIITDHHTIPDELPNAVAIVNPKLNSQENPYYQLAGTGVAFMLSCVFLHHLKIDTKQHFNRNLEIAAVGTVADMVPLKKANRTIVFSGLQKMNDDPSLSIKLLSSNESPITSSTIGFKIGPKINAAGRIDEARHSFELLSSEDDSFTQKKAAELTNMNDNRKAIGQNIKESALDLVTNSMKIDDKAIIACSEEWHPGIIGIAASQIVAEKKKPVILIAEGKTFGRGSARSFGDIDIYKYLKQVSSLFTKFGGHKLAAGFEIPKENIKQFKKDLIEIINDSVTAEELVSKHKYDLDLSLTSINMNLIEEINRLAPFGIGNSMPVFRSDRLFVLESKLIQGKHIKMKVSDSTHIIDAIAFNMSNKYNLIKQGKIDLLYTAEINEYRNKKNIQLKIIDMRQSKTKKERRKNDQKAN